MTRLALVVPGLIWPSPQPSHPAGSVPHTALARLLGRGQLRMEPAISFDGLLAQLLGMEGSLPLAALRRLGEGSDAQDDGGAHWFCADPVNLSFMGSHVLLDEFNEDEGEIDALDAAALVASLNEEFASLGRFSAATPTRWYLRMERPAKAHFFPLDEATCRPVQEYLPTDGEGDEAKHWRHMLNEIQVMLHNHPVNIGREAVGRRPVNSVWFWGNNRGQGNNRNNRGQTPIRNNRGQTPITKVPITKVIAGKVIGVCPRLFSPRLFQAVDPVARGLARAAGIEPDAPDVNRALRADTLVVLDTLAFAVRHLDLTRWQDALAALEQEWFAPVAQALDRGELRHFSLYAPGEHGGFSLTLGRGARWCFWRKPLPLSALAPT